MYTEEKKIMNRDVNHASWRLVHPHSSGDIGSVKKFADPACPYCEGKREKE